MGACYLQGSCVLLYSHQCSLLSLAVCTNQCRCYGELTYQDCRLVIVTLCQLLWSSYISQQVTNFAYMHMQSKVCLSEVQDRNAELDHVQECQDHETHILETEDGGLPTHLSASKCCCCFHPELHWCLLAVRLHALSLLLSVCCQHVRT